MATYNIYEAKTHFSKLVEQATRGEEVVIAKAGQPILRMVPVETKPVRAKREFGQNLLGTTYLAPNFYDDLPLGMFEVLSEGNDSE